jgi:choline-sulfatase
MLRLLVIVLLLPLTLIAAPPKQPNLVFILADDQAKWTVGCYGYPQAKTPNLDKLAASGVRFDSAFVVTPVCSPSRTSFFTGRHGIEFGITDWISPAEKPIGLPENAITWPRLLHDAGYKTALIGKWHLGANPHQHPTKQGFDYFYGHIGGGWSPRNPTLEVQGESKTIEGFSVDILTDDAIRWIQENNSNPFAICVHYREPHAPYGPMPPQDEAVFANLDPEIPDAPFLDKEQVKKATRQYLAACTAIDRNVGRILEQLDKSKLTDNTIVIYTSDHGYNIGHHTIQHKGNGHWIAGGARGPKRPNMWDTSLSIPLIIRWPGAMSSPGTVLKPVVSNLDILPTVLTMCGVPAPASAKIRGKDFSGFMNGSTPTKWSDDLFGAYDLHNGGLAYMRMVRTPEWKLVKHLRANGMDELYDLKNDPGEIRNLYNVAKSKAPKAQLETKLRQWMASMDDPLLAEWK